MQRDDRQKEQTFIVSMFYNLLIFSALFGFLADPKLEKLVNINEFIDV